MYAVVCLTLLFTIGESHNSNYEFNSNIREKMNQVQSDVNQCSSQMDDIEQDVREFIAVSNKKMQDERVAFEKKQREVNEEIANVLESLNTLKKSMGKLLY